MDVMLCDYRRWLEYDSVAVAVLFVGVGLVELIVAEHLRMCLCSHDEGPPSNGETRLLGSQKLPL
jgi:hypothetical protein